MPLLLVFSLEYTLKLIGFGRETGFLISDSKPGYVRTNPDFVSWFMPSNFDLRPLNWRILKDKPENTIRIVVLGESAAQGVPYPSFGFANQLRAQLRTRYPNKNIEILNTGIVAINSHVIYQIAKELSSYSPDLFIIYMGNNEVVGPYGPGCSYLSTMPPLPVIRLSIWLESTRTGQLLNSLIGKFSHRVATKEWRGMSMFVDSAVRGDDTRLNTVYANFKINLLDTIQLAHKCGAKVLLSTVVYNLKDCAPFLSLHKVGLNDKELSEWEKAYSNSILNWRLDRLKSAEESLKTALRIDPQYAASQYLMGQIELKKGNTEEARKLFIDSSHWDALRFRPDKQINEIIRYVASTHANDVTLLDSAQNFGSEINSSTYPSGKELLFEHVHLNWDGNYRIAESMAKLSENILFSHTETKNAWLSPESCKSALGYSDHEKYLVLQKLAAITKNPPFTGHLDYIEEAASLNHEIEKDLILYKDKSVLKDAEVKIKIALTNDPLNPNLLSIAEEIEDASGDLQESINYNSKAGLLQPENFGSATDKAIKLSRLGKFNESELLLKATLKKADGRDMILMAPAFADFYVRTKRYDEGVNFINEKLKNSPNNSELLYLRARLKRYALNDTGAIEDLLNILKKDPSFEKALEELIKIYASKKDGVNFKNTTFLFAKHQLQNQENNLRAALISQSENNSVNELKYLLAAELSGPVNTAVEVQIAKIYLKNHNVNDALHHLALARRLALIEENDSFCKTVDQAIYHIESQLNK